MDNIIPARAKVSFGFLTMYPNTMRDPDIQVLDGHLNSIVRENQQHHENLQGLLEKFQGLLESYYRLKSDYEEEKMAREKYKKMARGQV